MSEPDQADMRALITQITDEVREMLLIKNAAYGNSAADPVRVFSRCDAVEAINVRMDDKLSRIARGSDAGEDTEWDLIGYLILKRAVMRFRRGDTAKVAEEIDSSDPCPHCGKPFKTCGHF